MHLIDLQVTYKRKISSSTFRQTDRDGQLTVAIPRY